MIGKTQSIRERRVHILRELSDRDWLRPMDVGGFSRSHHSPDLLFLTKEGYVERRRRWAGISGGSNRYRRTALGKKALEELKETT